MAERKDRIQGQEIEVLYETEILAGKVDTLNQLRESIGNYLRSLQTGVDKYLGGDDSLELYESAQMESLIVRKYTGSRIKTLLYFNDGFSSFKTEMLDKKVEDLDPYIVNKLKAFHIL